MTYDRNVQGLVEVKKQMINSTDLRIGNLIQTATDSPLIIIATADILSAIDRGHDLYSGIPLTEEWLEKCRFNTVTESSAGKRYSIVENHIFNNDLTVVYWKTTSNAGKIMRGDLEIKYVHQLQNLVFALTGAELTAV